MEEDEGTYSLELLGTTTIIELELGIELEDLGSGLSLLELEGSS
jgi:hypothetical protein